MSCDFYLFIGGIWPCALSGLLPLRCRGWQGVLESCWVTIPLMFTRTGGRVVNGATPSVWGFGQAAFQAMTIAVNMKLLFVQKVRCRYVQTSRP